MKYTLDDNIERSWKVEKIGVIGPGIVGMPMAALLAHSQICIGTEIPAKVHVVQRNSKNSGWKVEAINQGQSVIGGIEPGLDDIVDKACGDGLLSAGYSCDDIADADVILVAIQTDKDEGGIEPDYGPMMGGLTSLAEALQNKPEHKIPLIIFESTLAPSTMTSVFREHFSRYGLVEGKDILLGNSPNRVMPGRLVARVAHSDKLVAGLDPATPTLISHLYRHIVTQGILHQANSMTAEVVKTLENAYRDVRIAFSAEIAAYCDVNDIDFYAVRDRVNERLEMVDEASSDPNCVPSGGLLIPMVGVGGHCLPKDGILLLWRRLLSGADNSQSLILKSREINDDMPGNTIAMLEKSFGSLGSEVVAILGTAYRFNSEDTRNSPSIQLALQLIERGCKVVLHDPYVKPDDQNLLKFKVELYFTRDLEAALSGADYLVFATGHRDYASSLETFQQCDSLKGVVDGCNLFNRSAFEDKGIGYTGIGRGSQDPEDEFIDFVYHSFQVMEHGLANEVDVNCAYLNDHYATNEFSKVDFQEVRRLAASCSTGCNIARTAELKIIPEYKGYFSQLAKCAVAASTGES